MNNAQKGDKILEYDNEQTAEIKRVNGDVENLKQKDNELQEEINNLKKDSGWIDLSLLSGITTPSTFKIRKTGKLVEIRGVVTKTSGFPKRSFTDVCLIPEKYRLSGELNTATFVGGGFVFGVQLNSNENILKVYNTQQETHTSWVGIDITYLVD